MKFQHIPRQLVSFNVDITILYTFCLPDFRISLRCPTLACLVEDKGGVA